MTARNKNLAPPMTPPSAELAKELRVSSEKLAEMYGKWTNAILKRAPTVSERITLALSVPFFQAVEHSCRAELSASTTSAQRKAIAVRQVSLETTISAIQVALDFASDRDLMMLA
jgi:hypothetical protein